MEAPLKHLENPDSTTPRDLKIGIPLYTDEYFPSGRGEALGYNEVKEGLSCCWIYRINE